MAAYDLAVIGGGPGGYVAAIRAAQLGLKTVLFERDRLGGLCLNWGCIPSKAILRNADVVNLVRESAKWGIGGVDGATFDLGAAIDRSRKVVDQLVHGVEGLCRDNGIEVIQGLAGLAGTDAVSCNGQTYQAKHIILATGASARGLPGVAVDGKRVMTSRDALEVRTPPANVVIVGAGPIGVEFAHIWASYGSTVTIVELLDDLMPLEDPDVGRQLRRSFEARGIRCMVKTKVDGIEVTGANAKVTAGGEAIEADLVLVAIGFTPHTDGLNLEAAAVKTERGFITIGDRMETNVPGIYAIGDVTGKLMLAHVAMQQALVAAEHIAGQQVPLLDYVQMPRATFCQPQVGSIGYTEQGAKDAGFTVKTGRFPLAALGRAIAMGETEGFVKVVADKKTGQVLGVHMIGHDINDLLGEASLAALLEATTVELGFAVHAHPTLTEALKEAALAADGEAIHIARRPRAAAAPATTSPSGARTA
ncbi:MAG: dihydrolipoyl dehydrogenase [Dehalococcoidia bacterium]|nr:dihydrolipoyl dehydrogenase [Dehalococcoidia bacterium]